MLCNWLPAGNGKWVQGEVPRNTEMQIVTSFATYKDYQIAMADIMRRHDEAAALGDRAKQAACALEAERVRNANPQWAEADRAWTGRNLEDDEDDDDFDGD